MHTILSIASAQIYKSNSPIIIRYKIRYGYVFRHSGWATGRSVGLQRTRVSPGQTIWGGHIWRARRSWAYAGVWGGAPSGVQGQSPWSGGQGRSPPEAENLLCFGAQRKHQFASFSVFCKLSKPQVIVIIHVNRLKVSSTMAWTSTERNLELQCLWCAKCH